MTGLESEGCWPNPGQELLLKAALWHGPAAVTAFEKWDDTVGMDRIDAGSQRLLPLVQQNLRALGVDHPLMKTFKGIYRRTWYENQIAFHHTSAVLRSLEQAGIPTLLLKGAALVSVYYKDAGLRPMSDVDILVPTDKAADAIRVLMSMSCTPRGERRASVERLVQSEVFKEFVHSEHFSDAGGREFDLHWHVLTECLEPDADDDFWNASVPVFLSRASTRVLCPADQLLHLCFHGAEWNEVPPVRWIADAMIVMRASPDLDWERVVHQAQKRGLVLEMKNAFAYLRRALNAQIPQMVFHALENSSVSRSERARYRARTRPPHFATDSLVVGRRYLRSVTKRELGHPLIGFPKFLQQVWGLDHTRQVPAHIASETLFRLRRKLRSLTSGSSVTRGRLRRA
jgi:hypothetical protein